MNQFSLLNLCKYAFLIALGSLTACSTSRVYRTTVEEDGVDRISELENALTDSSVLLMPYNRVVDPAGTVVRFGNPATENHSLDCALLPGENIAVVEDRFGVAFLDVQSKKLLYHLDYEGTYKGLKSTYAGVKVWKQDGKTHVFWGAANPVTKASFLVDAVWNGKQASISELIPFTAAAPAPMALPNDLALREEAGETYAYVVLNGNNTLVKIRLRDQKEIWSVATGMAPYGVALAGTRAYVTNWAGAPVSNTDKATAGIPYGQVPVDPRTGATASGTVSVIDLQAGRKETDISVGLHPSAILASPDGSFLYIANGNSDDVSVIRTATASVVETISVKLNGNTSLIGDSPNALALDAAGTSLYVSNGLDNAVAVVRLGAAAATSGKGKTFLSGFIPTEAYPAGLLVHNNNLVVCNLEGEGARVATPKGFSCHQQEATVSIIPLPETKTLQAYTKRVERANLLFRTRLSQLLPRKGVAPRPVPERIGEPSVFKHVVYIIKENKTYDQVLGDLPEGNGMKSLCIYGNDVTPNEHQLAKDYSLLDNYYASGKSSAEGHSWTDAAMVTDYVEKNVFAWFRSYPHVLADALVYSKKGFLWNNALNHGKTVRIYGEACTPRLPDGQSWTDIYRLYKQKQPVGFTNTTTIASVEPVLSPTYPCFDGQRINDQVRADAFISELKSYESLPGDQWPQLMILALPADHTAGMREGYPTPRAMVADNDLALGRIIEALTASRFWDSTVVFVTQDDPQSGWDHVSAYRTTGFVISPFSALSKTVSTNYNQTSMVRTIEQILGLPPMNVVDASALPMFDCFSTTPRKMLYTHLKNTVPLDEMNKPATALRGKARKYTILSSQPQFDHIDGGDDALLNRIVWYSVRGNQTYPEKWSLSKDQQDDDDD